MVGAGTRSESKLGPSTPALPVAPAVSYQGQHAALSRKTRPREAGGKHRCEGVCAPVPHPTLGQ